MEEKHKSTVGWINKLWIAHLKKIPSAMKMGNQNYTSQKLILQTYVESKKQDIKEKLQNKFPYLKLKSRKKNEPILFRDAYVGG